MTTIEIPEQLDAELEALAARNGASKTEYLRQAISTFLEDMDDLGIARERLLSNAETISLEELKKNLGLNA